MAMKLHNKMDSELLRVSGMRTRLPVDMKARTDRRGNDKGQAALILILLAAAALIFLAITLNWGRIAQTKTQISIAADQAATLLASSVASYGELYKVQYLDDQNLKSSVQWGFIITLIIIVILIVITILTWGATSPLLVAFLIVAIVAAIANVILQATVVLPGEVALWNKLQEHQPVQERVYEGAVGPALAGAGSDQVKIADFFDENTNGILGSGLFPKDSISRFGFFYSERLKMLLKKPSPQLDFFYRQLYEFINGQTCLDNWTDYGKWPDAVALNPSCIDQVNAKDYCDPLNTDPLAPVPCSQGPPIQNTITCSQNVYENQHLATLLFPIPVDATCPAVCLSIPSDPSCSPPGSNPVSNQFSFQLSDACPADESSPNPYCNPCCQPMVVNGKPVRPTSCYPYTTGYPVACFDNLKAPGCFNTTNASGCPHQRADPSCPGYDPIGAGFGPPPVCFTGPYGPSYPYIYDLSYQANYNGGVSFLEQYGRDQQILPSPPPPLPQTMTPVAGFPNGIYPFFWQMKDYSPRVDNIDPTTTALTAPQDHWCVAGTPMAGGGIVPAVPPTPGFADLNQLSLSYACLGKDCCVNYLLDNLTGPGGSTNGPIDLVGSPSFTYSSVNPTQPLVNPAVNDTNFGEPKLTPPTTWMEVDNQMCSSTWPYNGAPIPTIDGHSCQWNNAQSLINDVDINTSLNPPKLTFYPGISTVDGLDDVMHIFSDFTKFAQVILGEDLATLTSTFHHWYPEAAKWIALEYCEDPTCTKKVQGHLLSIYEPNGYPGVSGLPSYTGLTVDKLKDWNTVITNWLNTSYTTAGSTSAADWCLPDESTIAGSAEDIYINKKAPAWASCTPDTPCPKWGDLPHVISCLNYYANTDTASCPVGSTCSALTTYQNCLNKLPVGACPAGLPTECTPATLGRSLINPAVEPEPLPAAFNPATSCALAPGTLAQWVKDNITLFSQEQPKFVLRSEFLTDVYIKAKTLQNITAQADIALHNFLRPCATATDCADGGPAAQLIWLKKHGGPTVKIPNSVVYGWRDKPPSGGHGGCPDPSGHPAGCWHITRVEAYSPGRNRGFDSFIDPDLPKIEGFISYCAAPPFFLPVVNYELTHRDGQVFVSIQRWDQDHSNTINFPNGHALWQYMFRKPSSVLPGGDLGTDCSIPYGLSKNLGIGLGDTTAEGLKFYESQGLLSTTDRDSLGEAFMLNENPDCAGTRAGCEVDHNANGGGYATCYNHVHALLDAGMESRACAKYMASKNSSLPSSPPSDAGGFDFCSDCCSDSDQQDYSIKFVPCDGSFPPQPSKP